jgi:hypothetical protein
MSDESRRNGEQGESDWELAGPSDQRPVPAAGFRGALARRLAAEDPGYGSRPARLRWMVAGCCAGGSLLIAGGALLAKGSL